MIDLRSDTVTKLTPEMRQASFDALVGDDVYGEDPTINELEVEAAKLLGKEAALFVTSGTQGNQIAVLTHCKPGDEMIVEYDSHLFCYEGAGASVFAGVQPHVLKGNRGILNPKDVQAAIRHEDIHLPETGLICLENTHNRAGGTIVPLENMKAIYEIATDSSIPVHLDGARLFHATVATGISLEKYASYADSVQVCLSKGLGAPVGSIIAGTEQFIKKARKWRKTLGGGLRQAGVIAAPGLVALRKMIPRLAEDHDHAKRLATGLSQVKGLHIETEVETNIVLVNVKNSGYTATTFLEQIKEHGILGNAFGPYTVRFVTHYDVTSNQMDEAIQKIKAVLEN